MTERRELESIEGEWIPHMAFEFSSNELRLAVVALLQNLSIRRRVALARVLGTFKYDYE